MSDATIADWDGDFFDEAVLTNPEPFYAELRARGPLVRLSRYDVLAVGRYQETYTIFSDWKRFVSSRGVGLTDFKKEKPWRQPSIVLEVDPPEHTRTRTVLNRALSPGAVNRLKDTFRAEAEALIDRLLEVGTFDAVPDLAEAFPLKVFPDAVGISPEGRENLLLYGSMVFNALGPDNAPRRAAMAHAPVVVPWINQRCAREAITADGFAATIYQGVERGEVNEVEAGMLVRSLLSAGVDTTVTGIGSALWCLATNPDQYALLRADASLVRPAFEEVLRFTSPVSAFCRTANQDTEVSGLFIPEGSKILCMLGAANLDENKWPEAHRFKVARKPTGHLAFGVGIHGCVGQTVARAESEAVLSVLREKVATIELAGEPVWQANNSMHLLKSLPIRITRA
ncbi:MAG: cytochrome [Hyphomicrobiales bacterium]|nr:cytochrome [Hyphomicrobiales bacterium]